MCSTLKFQHIQRAFAAHIRDPEHYAPPVDVEDRRMAIYRELFYNNIEGMLARGFPVLHSLHARANWHALVRVLFAEHRCRSPYFKDIGQAFVESSAKIGYWMAAFCGGACPL